MIMEKNKLNLLRKVLIGLLLVTIFTGICVIEYVSGIIHMEHEPVPVADNIESYVDADFDCEKRMFEEENSSKIEKYYGGNHFRHMEAVEYLYMNQLYRDTYGEDSFKDSIDSDGKTVIIIDSAYKKRVARLRKRAREILYPQWKKEYQIYTKEYQRYAKEHKEHTDAMDKTYLTTLLC